MFLFALQSGLESFATDQYEYPEISCRMDEYLNMESGARHPQGARDLYTSQDFACTLIKWYANSTKCGAVCLLPRKSTPYPCALLLSM